MTLLDTSWMDDGACRDAKVDVWFPEKGEDTAAAKQICADCPVRDQCLNYALDHDERFGVWGGLSQSERRRLRRSRKRAA